MCTLMQKDVCTLFFLFLIYNKIYFELCIMYKKEQQLVISKQKIEVYKKRECKKNMSSETSCHRIKDSAVFSLEAENKYAYNYKTTSAARAISFWVKEDVITGCNDSTFYWCKMWKYFRCFENLQTYCLSGLTYSIEGIA